MTNERAHELAPRASGAGVEDWIKVYCEGEAAAQALCGVRIKFEAGRFTAVIGPSGSGRSRLLHCLAGLDTPILGKVFLGDVDLTRLSERDRR